MAGTTYPSDPHIEQKGNGWFKASLRVTPSTHGVTERRTFVWRKQEVQCCSSGPSIIVAHGRYVPIWFDEHGGAHGLSAMCGNCGSHHFARFKEHDYAGHR